MHLGSGQVTGALLKIVQFFDIGYIIDRKH
jgi:hypothetical protein